MCVSKKGYAVLCTAATAVLCAGGALQSGRGGRPKQRSPWLGHVADGRWEIRSTRLADALATIVDGLVADGHIIAGAPPAGRSLPFCCCLCPSVLLTVSVRAHHCSRHVRQQHGSSEGQEGQGQEAEAGRRLCNCQPVHDG